MTAMLRALLLCLTMGLLGACASAPTKSPVLATISTLKDVPAHVSAATPPVLLVLDIDDTLLTTPEEGSQHRKFFGSDRWFSWQRKMRAAPNQDPRVPCMSDVNGMIYESGSQVATEKGAQVGIINALTVDRLALTSRHPRYRGPTEREWFRAGYQELPMLPDNKKLVVASRIVAPDPKKPMVYQRGIFMTGGGDKGVMLTELLRQLKRLSHYKTVILVDDGPSNISNMDTAMKAAGIAYEGLLYDAVKKPLPADPTSDEQDEGQSDWAAFREALKTAFPARWAELRTGTSCGLPDP